MGWNDIKYRINESVLEPNTIDKIIKSCLEKKGMNKTHSRKIKIEGYLEPQNDEENINQDAVESLKYEIIRHIAQALLENVPQDDRAKVALPVSDYIDGWDMLDNVKVGNLMSISKMTNDKIEELLKSDNTTNSSINFIKNVYQNCCDFENEHNGVNPPYNVEKTSREEKNSDPFGYGYNKRIYLNPPYKNMSTYIFLTEYIKKCIDERIPFDMKGKGSLSHSEDELDGMVLYSNNTYFDKHLTILEEIINENPDLIDTFGTPICTGGMVTGKDGICHYTIASGSPQGGKSDNGLKISGENIEGTYNDYIDNAINFTYIIACSKLVKENISLLRSMGETVLLEDDFIKTIEYFENIGTIPSNELRTNIILSKSRTSEIGKKANKIRELAYKVIDFKDMTGKEEKYVEMLKSSFGENFERVCSILKFNDKEHIETPIYQDESFLDFVAEHEKDRLSMKAIVRNAILKGTTFEDVKNADNIEELSRSVEEKGEIDND